MERSGTHRFRQFFETMIMTRNTKKNGLPLYRQILICILFSSLLWACANPVGPPCIKNGKHYGVTSGIFRSQWDDYYERGLSYAEGECYSAALADFATALKGNKRDDWMVRTFGMHFIDYFPHREKGIVHFYMGDMRAAEKELEISLQQKKTEKAAYYLNRVRKKILEEKHAAAGSPVIIPDIPQVKSGRSEIRTNKEIICISGTVTDENYVHALNINGEKIPVPPGKSSFFSQKIKTVPGWQEINITAENLLGGKSAHLIRIFTDRAGPLILIRHMSVNAEGGYLLEGYLEDDSAVSSFFINGQAAEMFPDAENEKKYFFAFLSHTSQIRILAKDSMGNETEAAFSFPAQQQTPEFHQRENAGNPLLFFLLAQTSVMTDSGYFLPKPSDPASGPQIYLAEWQENDFSFAENIRIRGHVRSSPSVVSIRINGDTVSSGPGSLIFFSHPLFLNPEENAVEISAEDESGRRSVRKIRIVHKKQAVYHLKHRYSLLIHPFRGGKKNADVFNNGFSEKLFQGQRFQIYQQENTVSPLKRKAGGTDGILSGRIYETHAGTEIVARMIDRTSSEILTTEDVYAEAGSVRTVKDIAGELCEKLIRACPLVTGEIREIDRRKIQIRTGEKRLKNGWPLIVYRPEPRSHRGSDTRILGSAALEELGEDTYGAWLSDGCGKDIQTGDRIISK
ncbi:MAG: hypothetical protein V2I97_16150 [Desulfococcaceae bacterium]|jgi:hypothetical protein|nr:hypothetical protein [Desulfococcaceae bacterium]